MSCPKHRRYQAKRKPRSLCEDCWGMWLVTKPSPFWQSVSELAAMRVHIPGERRVLSGVRAAVRSDVPKVQRAKVCKGCSDCAMGGSGVTCVPGNY